MSDKDRNWSLVIKPRTNWLNLRLGDIWKYRDLLLMFVNRDFVSSYKQTILGPVWFFLQPVLTTLVFTVIFGNIAQLPTDGLPHILFYMTGIVGWNYFSDCLTKTSNTFTTNSAIFGKVYFPRLIVPLSIVISSFVKFLIQFILMIGFLFFYLNKGANIHPNSYILLTPVLMVIMAMLGLGFGIIVSSLTTKYRDLQYLVGFGVQLMMYVTPVVFPMSYITGKFRWVMLANPMTPVIEAFKYAFLGAGSVNVGQLIYSAAFTFILLFAGLLIFHRVENNFMDNV